MQEAAVEVVVEVLQRVGNDPVFVLGIELLARADGLELVCSLAANLINLIEFRGLTRHGN